MFTDTRANVRRDAPSQPAEHAAGADFNEHLGAEFDEPVHAIDPAHRRRELCAQPFAQFGGGTHVTCIDVAHHRWMRVGDRHTVERRTECGCRCAHQRRMECAAHIERNRAPRTPRECQLRGRVNARDRAADHQLTRRVVIGDDHDLSRLALRLVADRGCGVDVDADQRAHRSLVHRRHRPTALDDDTHRVRRLQRMRRRPRQRTRRRCAPRPRRRRGRRARCCAARIRRTGARVARSPWGGRWSSSPESAARRSRPDSVRRIEHFGGDREVGQPVRHSGGLAALSGKAECDAGHQDRMATR